MQHDHMGISCVDFFRGELILVLAPKLLVGSQRKKSAEAFSTDHAHSSRVELRVQRDGPCSVSSIVLQLYSTFHPNIGSISAINLLSPHANSTNPQPKEVWRNHDQFTFY